MGPNLIANFGVACTNQLDSDGFDTIHVFGGGFAFSQETCASNVTTPSNALLTNSTFKDFFPECIGDAFIYSPNASVTGNYFIGGYQLNVGQTYCTQYHQPGIVANAPITVSNFSNNTMIATQWGTPFSNSIYPGNASANSTTPSVIRASTITSNTWRDDQSIISFGSASFPFLFMPSGSSSSNKFEVGVDGANANRSGRGYFMNVSGGNISSAGDPLGYYLGSSAGNALGPVQEYAWGETYAGVAGTTANSGQIAPVYTEYTGQWTVPSNAGPIAGGQPVFPAPGGFYPSVGTPFDVGTESFGIGYGNQYGNTGAGQIMGTNRSTPSNASAQTAVVGATFAGYAASGSTSFTVTSTYSGAIAVNQAIATPVSGIVPGTTIAAYSGGVATLSIPTFSAVGSSGSPVGAQSGFAITTANTDFTTVPSGAITVLTGNVPVGSGVRVCNDGANSMSVYPPAGQFFTNDNALTLATATCADYRRLSSTLWR